MKIGIFAKTFSRPTDRGTVSSDRRLPNLIPSNSTCPALGLTLFRKTCHPRQTQRIADSAEQATVELSRHFRNVQHGSSGSRGVEARNLTKFEVLCDVAATLHIPVITLCTGTRDPVNMWKWHSENDSKEAWDDMVQTMDSALDRRRKKQT